MIGPISPQADLIMDVDYCLVFRGKYCTGFIHLRRSPHHRVASLAYSDTPLGRRPLVDIFRAPFPFL